MNRIISTKDLKTPAYIFSKTQLTRSYLSICEKMTDIDIYYSLKANAETSVIEHLASICTGFEVASDGEFERALSVGIPSEKIICGLPVKKISTIEHLYQKGCNYFIFDMDAEFKKLIKYAPNAKKILRIYINDLLPHCLEFGMPFQEIKRQIDLKEITGETIDGIAFHISENTDIVAFNKVWDRILSVVRLLNLYSSQEFIINIGGGYRNYASNDFFSNLQHQVYPLKKQYPNISIIAEPGNAIVNDSGMLVTKVIAVRNRDGFTDVYMDAGKPTGLKTDNKRLPDFINVANKTLTKSQTKYRFIDITCMHRPHFTYDLPYDIETNDILVFGGMGAYTACLQSMFHVWSSPNIYMVE